MGATLTPGPQETGEVFALEFDYRSDAGPRLVGPFASRGAAQTYALNLNLEESVYSICPMKCP